MSSVGWTIIAGPGAESMTHMIQLSPTSVAPICAPLQNQMSV